MTNSKTKEPQVTKELLEYLKDKFSMDYFLRVSTQDELKEYQGKQHVINHLERLHNRQNNKGNVL